MSWRTDAAKVIDAAESFIARCPGFPYPPIDLPLWITVQPHSSSTDTADDPQLTKLSFLVILHNAWPLSLDVVISLWEIMAAVCHCPLVWHQQLKFYVQHTAFLPATYCNGFCRNGLNKFKGQIQIYGTLYKQAMSSNELNGNNLAELRSRYLNMFLIIVAWIRPLPLLPVPFMYQFTEYAFPCIHTQTQLRPYTYSAYSRLGMIL